MKVVISAGITSPRARQGNRIWKSGSRSAHLSPARGERSDCRGDAKHRKAIRVRGRIDKLGFAEAPPHPEPSLRSDSDLSPQAGAR